MTKMISYTILVLLAAAMIVGFMALRGDAQTIDGPFFPIPYTPPLDNAKLIIAIRRVENWDGYSEGKHGERGPSQIKLITWKQHTKRAWRHALYMTTEDQLIYREVEDAHGSWIRDVIGSRRLPDTAYTFALCWRAGVHNVLDHNITPEERSYAQRASNIYQQLLK